MQPDRLARRGVEERRLRSASRASCAQLLDAAAAAAPPRAARGWSSRARRPSRRSGGSCCPVRRPGGTRRARLELVLLPRAAVRARCGAARPPPARAQARSCIPRCRDRPGRPCGSTTTAASRLPCASASSPCRNALPAAQPLTTTATTTSRINLRRICYAVSRCPSGPAPGPPVRSLPASDCNSLLTRERNRLPAPPVEILHHDRLHADVHDRYWPRTMSPSCP